MEPLKKILLSFLAILLGHFGEINKELKDARSGVSRKEAFRDFFAVLKSVSMIVVFQLLAMIIFMFLPQGKDVLLVVHEDFESKHYGTLVWLAIATVIWAVISEFTTRYSIYVTDNSGHQLSPLRVALRLNFQRFLASLFLIIPFITIAMAMIWNYPLGQVNKLLKGEISSWSFYVPVGVIIGEMYLVSYIYFVRKKAVQQDSSSIEKKLDSIKWIGKVRRFIALPVHELVRCERLRGIYSDEVFDLRKSSNFSGDAWKSMREMEEKIFSFDNNGPLELVQPIVELPKDKKFVSPDAMMPKAFNLRQFSDEYKLEDHPWQRNAAVVKEIKPNGRFKWVYHVPTSFYKRLNTHVAIVFFLSLAIFLLAQILPAHNIGSPALVVFAFASWTGIYLGIIFMEFGVFRLGKPKSSGKAVRDNEGIVFKYPKYSIGNRILSRVPLRMGLFVLFLISSRYNNDHPARLTGASFCDNRPKQEEHFDKWIKSYTDDLQNAYYYNKDSSTFVYPVLLVCAEGGALRTGAYSAMFLSRLQDSLRIADTIDFKSSVYAYSGVSGGSLGISLFAAMAYLDDKQPLNYSKKAKSFMQGDFLSGIISKMFYTEIAQLFIPFHIDSFDRAIELEEEWEDAYASEFVSATFGRDYQSLWCKVRETKPIRSYPAMFINTTEVETGRQCWISNVRASDQMFSASECDLLRSKVNGGLRYSTAVNFSSRFPLFSPAACLPQTSSGNYKLHYVDGGYYENSGAKTMLEIIHALKKKNGEISQSDFRIVPQNINQKTNARKSPPNLVWEEPSNLSAQGHRKVIKPYVILFRFSDPFESNKQVNWLNELNEVGSAMYNSRSAHTKQAVEEMHRLKKELGFEVIELTMSKSAVEVPMNWVLSDRSIDHIDTLISNQWRDHKLEKLCFFDSLYSKVVRPTGPSH